MSDENRAAKFIGGAKNERGRKNPSALEVVPSNKYAHPMLVQLNNARNLQIDDNYDDARQRSEDRERTSVTR